MGALTGALAVGGIIGFVKSAIDGAEALDDMSKRLGVSVENLAGLKLVAETSGTSLEGLAGGLQKLSKSLGEAATGNKELGALTEALGIKGLSANEAFVKLAGILPNIADANERNAIAAKLFGKSYADLLPALSEGEEGLRKLIERGRELSPITDDMSKQAKKFKDQLAEMQMMSSYAGIALAKDLLPSLNQTAAEMIKLKNEGHGVLALLRGFAGLGKLPFDFLIGGPDFSVAGQIKDLREELEKLEAVQRGDRGRLSLSGLLPSGEEGRRRIEVLKNQIAALEKFQDQIRKPKDTGVASGESDAIVKIRADTCRAMGGVWDEKTRTCKTMDVSVGVKMPNDIFLGANGESVYERANAAFVTKSRDTAEFIKQQARDFNELQKELGKEQAEAAQKQADEIERLKAEYIDLIDPVEKYRKKLDDIDKLVAAGEWSQDKAAEARFKIQMQIEDLNKLGETVKDNKDFAKEFGLTFSSALEDIIVKGGDARSVLQALGQDILRIVARKTITEPLGNAISGAVQSSGIFSAIGDWFSGLFASAKGNVFSGGELMRFASGGAFTNRVVGGPTLFPMGVMGEAGPEAIMPLARDGSGRLGVRGASGGVTVIVNNNAPGTVARANATQGEGGQRMIEIIVEQVEGKVWGNVARGAGPGPSVLSHTYGLNRVAGAY
jgi:hypothetical protein